jgi:hypothetical protein
LRKEETVSRDPARLRETYGNVVSRMQDMIMMEPDGIAIGLMNHFATGGAAIGVEFFDRF